LNLKDLETVRTREGPIRTISQIPRQLKVFCLQTLPIHEILAAKIRELKTPEITNRDIALKFAFSTAKCVRQVKNKNESILNIIK
jgi:hypothetical protein